MEIQESVHLDVQTNEIIHKCVQLRKKYNYTILELSKILEIDRRKISSFEKGGFSLNLADIILSYFGHNLVIWSTNGI
jgi:predicted transcriptional regulator